MKKNYIFLVFVALTSYSLGQSPDAVGAPAFPVYNLDSFTNKVPFISSELIQLTPEVYRTHPEFGVEAYGIPCEDCDELIDRRTSNTKYFVKRGTNGSKFFSTASYNDIHYKDEEGNWITIDPRLKKVDENIYSASHQLAKTTLNFIEGYTSILLFDKNEFKFNQHLSIYSTNDFTDTSGKAQINRSEHTVGDNGAFTKNAFSNIDEQLIFGKGSVKSNYILNDLSSIDLTKKYFVIEDVFTVPENCSLVYDQYEGQMNTDNFWFGDLVLENESGFELARYLPPVMFDLSEDIGEVPLSELIGYKISQEGNLYTVKVIIDIEWLKSSERVFPITIDPTVFGTTTTWTGTQGMDDSPTWCSVVLSVPTPAMATLTGSSVHWELYAVGGVVCGGTGCRRDDVQVQIVTTCDTSPAPGGVWVCFPGCNSAGWWVPTVDDATTADLVECFTPQCSSFNIDFTLQFNQFSCVTAGGCVTTCAYVTELQVTIEGETVTVTALAEGATSYTVTDCTDQSGWLSCSTPNYGVSPYTYSWSTGATTSSTYVTFPMGVTVYTVTITDACGNTATDNVTVTNGCAVLPIDLVSFSGYNSNGVNHLNWSTESEENNSMFLIERSGSGENFEMIGAVEGGGTTNQVSDYTYIDRSPFDGLNYYRLKQVDFDGNSTYSNVIAIKSGDFISTEILINYQDLENHTLDISIFSAAEGNALLQIFDVTGKSTYSDELFVTSGETQVNLHLPEIARGAYIISFAIDGQSAETKFIK